MESKASYFFAVKYLDKLTFSSPKFNHNPGKFIDDFVELLSLPKPLIEYSISGVVLCKYAMIVNGK
jgi:hypothetical protein